MVSISRDMTTQVIRLILALSLERGEKGGRKRGESGKTRKLEH